MENKTKKPISAAAEYERIAPDCTEEDFLSGRLGYALGFDNPNQIIVDQWSEGFQLTESLNAVDNIGLYCDAREQLAAYMRKRILGEYVKFGGAPALCGWYDETARVRRDLLIDLGARAIAVRRGTLKKPGAGYVAMDRFLGDPSRAVVRESNKVEDQKAAAEAPATFGSLRLVPATSDYVCAVTGESSTVSVEFVLNSWTDMELVLGEELPKLLIGWRRFRIPVKHRSKARYDPVGMVGAPIEHCMLAYYQSYRDYCEGQGMNVAREEQLLSNFNPSITIGYCEKGLQKVWKKLGI